MIVHELKAVHIHIPKTAGVSLEHAIMSEILGKDTSGHIGKMPNDLKYRFSVTGKQKHKQARFYLLDDDLTKQQWESYYKFAIVRNPWDRLVSEYCWRQDRPNKKFLPGTFDEFIDYCGARIKNKGTLYSRRDIYWTHAQTQKSYVTNKGKIILDEIFRFEHIPETIEALKGKLNLTFSRFKKYNSSKHKDYHEYYDNNTKAKVEKLYKEDIEMFGFDFDSPATKNIWKK